MKMHNKASRPVMNNFKNGAFLAPNRTIDESPLGDPEATQARELRDPLRAPGQNERTENPIRRGRRVDEAYGATEIPGGASPEERHEGGDLEKKKVEKHSSRPSDPRHQHEKQGEKERRGLEREFGKE